MTLKNKNPWKYLSVGLLGVIAIGLLAPVQAEPGGALSGWQLAVAELQTQVNAAVGDFQGQIDALVADLATEVSRATTAEAGIASDLADHETADGDLSDTNELQTLSESSPGVIALSDDGSVTVQDRVSDTCAVDSSIRAIAADGTVTCEVDTDTNTTYDETDFATSDQSCDTGEVVIGIAEDGDIICSGSEISDLNTKLAGLVAESKAACSAQCDALEDAFVGLCVFGEVSLEVCETAIAPDIALCKFKCVFS